MRLQAVDPKTLDVSVFQVFGTNNALLTAGDRTKSNTMTIGWCGLGRIWNMPACTVYVRPERYTDAFMAAQDLFTVSVPSLEDHDRIRVFGTKSGRDTDKLAESGFTLAYAAGDAPYIAESQLVLVCRKLYVQDLKPECLTDSRPEKFYQGEGWHRMYIGEVLEAYTKSLPK